jgi:hypothetical protein
LAALAAEIADTDAAYARLVSHWIASIGLDPRFFGMHSLR